MNYCDDGGACHHNCADRSGKCYRRQCCEPLSNVFPNDEWPPPSGAEVHETDPTLSKPTPTPSITVGTQVRLTGVVVTDEPDIDGDYAVAVEGARKSYNKVWFNPTDFRNLEVIRQPFKRGEVVWSCGAVATGEQFVVFNDENNGRVDVVHCDTGTATKGNDASRFERRP